MGEIKNTEKTRGDFKQIKSLNTNEISDKNGLETILCSINQKNRKRTFFCYTRRNLLFSIIVNYIHSSVIT